MSKKRQRKDDSSDYSDKLTAKEEALLTKLARRKRDPNWVWDTDIAPKVFTGKKQQSSQYMGKIVLNQSFKKEYPKGTQGLTNADMPRFYEYRRLWEQHVKENKHKKGSKKRSTRTKRRKTGKTRKH